MIRCTNKFALFYKEWPSNFCKTKFIWEAFSEKPEFFCTEQAFMWTKAKLFGDEEMATNILKSDSPMECKKFGRAVIGYDDKKWSEVRYDYMLQVNRARFEQDKGLQAKLLDKKFDGLVFVEASPYDRVWGVGLEQDDPRIDDEKNWLGTNLLGQAITQVREELLK